MSGVRLRWSFIPLNMSIQFSQHHLFKILFSLNWVVLAPLLKINWTYILGFISGILILFHCFISLVSCQYHNALIIVTSYYSLKSGGVKSPALFFFLRITLAFGGLLWLYTNFRIFFLNYSKKCLRNLVRDCVESIDGFCWYLHFNNINSSRPWTQSTFIFISAFFNFSHWSLKVFRDHFPS